jgi:hypothetical protein
MQHRSATADRTESNRDKQALGIFLSQTELLLLDRLRLLETFKNEFFSFKNFDVLVFLPMIRHRSCISYASIRDIV